MAYNNGFPINYPQMYPQQLYQQPLVQQNPVVPQQPVVPTVVAQPTTNADTGILWVQGEAGAKSWAVAPGKSVMLMDSEASTFYIKSSDMSGMPMPLRIFDYHERTQQQQQTPQISQTEYVTRQEFEKRIAELSTRKPVIVEEVENG